MNGPELCWQGTVPHSVFFNDKYYCAEDGYADAMAVMCAGNRLAERFRQLDPGHPGAFTILETGFGSGLNFCCAWEIWRASAPAGWTLHYMAVEKYPWSAAQIDRALSHWPQLDECRRALTGGYAPGERAVGIFEPAPGLRLTIAFDDVLAALDALHAGGAAGQGVDAVFLHGFAPSRNPAMWTEDVFSRIARMAHPGTTLATFTVAGRVRRGLDACGFRVAKVQGHGGKKEMLTGVLLAGREGRPPVSRP